MGSALGFSCATAAQEEKLFLIRIWVYTGWAATECRQHGFMQPDVIPISEWVSLQHCYYSSHNFFSFCSMAHNLSRVQPCFTVMSCGMVQGTMLCTHVYGSHVVGRVPPVRQATSHVVGYMPSCQATCHVVGHMPFCQATTMCHDTRLQDEPRHDRPSHDGPRHSSQQSVAEHKGLRP